MQEIRESLDEGLPMNQIKMYAKPKFDNGQMSQIRKGFEHGLTIEQVQAYANSKFTDEKMNKLCNEKNLLSSEELETDEEVI